MQSGSSIKSSVYICDCSLEVRLAGRFSMQEKMVMLDV